MDSAIRFTIRTDCVSADNVDVLCLQLRHVGSQPRRRSVRQGQEGQWCVVSRRALPLQGETESGGPTDPTLLPARIPVL